MTAEKLIIGIIRSSHGLTGNVKVASTSGEVEHFFNITEVTLKNGEIEKNFVVESVKGGSPTLYMKFKGIDSPEDAKTYFGWKILVPKTMACPLKEGEFYVEDLKGCSLIYCENDAHSKNNAKGASQKNASELLQKGIVVGSIADVLEGGANDLLEVVVSESLDAVSIGTDKKHRAVDIKNRTVLIPFQKEFIGTVDTENRAVQLMHLWILD